MHIPSKLSPFEMLTSITIASHQTFYVISNWFFLNARGSRYSWKWANSNDTLKRKCLCWQKAFVNSHNLKFRYSTGRYCLLYTWGSRKPQYYTTISVQDVVHFGRFTVFSSKYRTYYKPEKPTVKRRLWMDEWVILLTYLSTSFVGQRK